MYGVWLTVPDVGKLSYWSLIFREKSLQAQNGMCICLMVASGGLGNVPNFRGFESVYDWYVLRSSRGKFFAEQRSMPGSNLSQIW